MKKYNTLILGTDNNSYSVARSFNEAFNRKSIVAGSAVLVPFYNSKIAEVYTRENFSTDDDVFVSLLNEIGEKYSDRTLVFFVPTEAYLDILVRNLDRLEFDYRLPYPNREISEKLIHKSNFYSFLDSISVSYPKTEMINEKNLDKLSLDGDLFLKADDYESFVLLDFKEKQKGYKVSGKDQAKEILKTIFDAGYKGEMIVQQYINGGDGSEYSLNGYRSKDGKISMVLARNLLSDKREMWVGNHIVQVDCDDERMYDLAREITDKIDYHGLFNLDFKVDSKSGEIFVLEMNIRQGRTFYYSILGGVNLIEIAIRDQVLDESVEKIGSQKFRLTTLSPKAIAKHIDKSLEKEFYKEERIANSENPIKNLEDDGFMRHIKINEIIKKLERETFGK